MQYVVRQTCKIQRFRAFFPAVDLRERARQTLHCTGTEHQLHERIGFSEQCADLLLLGHAAAQSDDQPRIFLVDRL